MTFLLAKVKILNRILVLDGKAESSYGDIQCFKRFAKQLAVLFQNAVKQLPRIGATQAAQVCQ